MKKALWYLAAAAPLIFLILGYIFPSKFFASQEAIRSFVLQFGALAPIVFIVLQILQVVITPLSHYVVSIAGGFIFGLWPGFIYNWIGRVIGTAIAFYLGRTLGRRLIRHIISEKTIDNYDRYFEKGKALLFLAYFLPLFPDDELSYLAGISKMSPKAFLPIMALGHIGGSLGLAYTGAGITSLKDPLFIAILLSTLVAGLVFVFIVKTGNFRHR